MMNKRGEGGLQSLWWGIIWLFITFIGVYVLYTMISALGCSTIEKEQANAQSLKLKNFLENLTENSNGTFPLVSPVNWYLISYQKNDANVPTGFFMQNLVCICDKYDCKGINFCKEIKQPAFENAKNLNTKIYFINLNVTNKGTFYDARSIQAK